MNYCYYLLLLHHKVAHREYPRITSRWLYIGVCTKTSLQVFRQTLAKNCVTGLGAADMRVGGMFGHSGRQRRLLSPRFLSRSSNPDELPSSSQSLGNPLPYADTARVFARQFFNRRWLIGLRCLHVRGGVMSVGHVSEVTRRRARLVLSWVTVLGYYINLYSPKKR